VTAFGAFREINIATEFMECRCDWISWDEDVTGYHGTRMWLNFTGWRCNWISLEEKCD